MNGDVWCRQIVKVFKGKNPEMDLTFGGDAANFDIGQVPRLDMFLLEEDVVNLAMMSYKESISDYSHFSNPANVNLHFEDSTRVFTIFSGMFCI